MFEIKNIPENSRELSKFESVSGDLVLLSLNFMDEIACSHVRLSKTADIPLRGYFKFWEIFTRWELPEINHVRSTRDWKKPLIKSRLQYWLRFQVTQFHLCVTWNFHYLLFTKWECAYNCQNAVFLFSKITKAKFMNSLFQDDNR